MIRKFEHLILSAMQRLCDVCGHPAEIKCILRGKNEKNIDREVDTHQKDQKDTEEAVEYSASAPDFH